MILAVVFLMVVEFPEGHPMFLTSCLRPNPAIAPSGQLVLRPTYDDIISALSVLALRSAAATSSPSQPSSTTF